MVEKRKNFVGVMEKEGNKHIYRENYVRCTVFSSQSTKDFLYRKNLKLVHRVRIIRTKRPITFEI